MYNDIELKGYDKKYYQQNVSRKQKLRNISFAAIGKKFDEFRAKRALKKLEKAEKNLVDTRLFQSEVKPKHGISTAERIVNYRSEKVAKLESKINFLTTGEYPDKIAVKNRAIKLKEMMWKNFRLNSIGLYAIPAEVKNEIVNEEIKEEAQKEVPEVAESKVEVAPPIKEEVPLVTEDEIKKIKEAVQKKLEETTKEEKVDVNQINEEEMKSVVDDNFDKQKEEITTDDIYKKIDNDLQNISIEEGLIKEENPIKPIEQISQKAFPVIKPVTVKENVQKDNVNDDIFTGEKAKKIEVKEENVVETKIEDRESPVVVEDRENAYEKVKEDESKLNDLYTKLGEVAIDNTDAAKEIRDEIEKVENDFLENEEKLTEDEKQKLEAEKQEEANTEIKVPEETQVEEVQKEQSIDLSNVTQTEIEKVVDKVESSTNLEIKKARLNILKDAVLSTSKELEETNKELSKTEDAIEAAKNKELELEKKLALKYDEKNDEYTRKANDNKEMIDNNKSMINSNKSELEERNERIKRLQEMFDSFEKNDNEKEVEHKKK